MKRRILFVDDEPRVLRGLEHLLRPMRHEWEIALAESGAVALEMLRQSPFDVVVSDMRMPAMDGAQLLSAVKEQYPQVVRIILSGYCERDTILRSVGPTHQFLAKPCDPELLRDVIGRACALRDLLHSTTLRELVSQMHSIPSLPQTYLRMVKVMQSPDASIRDVGPIIASDMGMTAKVLQLVNSAFFGSRRHVSEPAQAAAMLGIEILKALVLSIHVFSQLDAAKTAGLSLDQLWNHSIGTGTLAKRIAEAEGMRGAACDHTLMAGLMHDVGKLVLAANLPDRYVEALRLEQSEGQNLCAAETLVFSATHAEVGAYLLGLWGLPDPIVEAVAHHHTPAASNIHGFSVLLAVHVANCLEHGEADSSTNAVPLDVAHLALLGLTERLPVWRELHEQVVQEANSP